MKTVSEKIIEAAKLKAAREEKLNAVQNEQQRLLDIPLEKHTPATVEALSADSYKRFVGLHGQQAVDDKLATFPRVQGARRIIGPDTHTPVFTRDVMARRISPEAEKAIQDGIRKTRLDEIEEGARILSEKEEHKEKVRQKIILSNPYTGPFAPILAEAELMTKDRYEEFASKSIDDTRHMIQWAKEESQRYYPLDHENPLGWDGKKLTDDEVNKIISFARAQDPAIDLTDSCNWYLIYLVLKCENIIRSRVHKIVMKLDPEAEAPRIPEPETITMKKNPYPKGSRDWEQYEREAMQFGNFQHYDSLIGPYLQEIADASGLRVPHQITTEIAAELEKRRLVPSRDNVRKLFALAHIKETPDPALVFEAEELNRWAEELRDNDLTASEYLKKYNLGTPSMRSRVI